VCKTGEELRSVIWNYILKVDSISIIHDISIASAQGFARAFCLFIGRRRYGEGQRVMSTPCVSRSGGKIGGGQKEGGGQIPEAENKRKELPTPHPNSRMERCNLQRQKMTSSSLNLSDLVSNLGGGSNR